MGVPGQRHSRKPGGDQLGDRLRDVEQERVNAASGDRYGFFGRVRLGDEMGVLTASLQKGQVESLKDRWVHKMGGHYNTAFNQEVKVREDSSVRTFDICDGVLRMRPGMKGVMRNEDFILMHESMHEKQRRLLGFATTEQMIDAYTGDLTTSELGRRDWVEKYSMPPFTMTKQEEQTLFAYYDTREKRKNIARGIRDIHSDTMALRKSSDIYLTQQEQRDGVNPTAKFLRQFKDELRANIPSYDVKQVKEGEEDFIRKIARFKAVSAGAAQTLGDRDYADIAQGYDQYMVRQYGTMSTQYMVYAALSNAYQIYFINCTQRTDLIDHELMAGELESPNQLKRIRAADFLGEVGAVAAISPLLTRQKREGDELVAGFITHALGECIPKNISEPALWDLVEGNTGNRALVFGFFNALQRECRLPKDAGERLLRIYGKIDYPQLLADDHWGGDSHMKIVAGGISHRIADVGRHNPEVIFQAGDAINDDTPKVVKGLVWANMSFMIVDHPQRCIDLCEKISEDKDVPYYVKIDANNGISLLNSDWFLHRLAEEAKAHPEQVLRIVNNLSANASKHVRREVTPTLYRMADYHPEALDLMGDSLLNGGHGSSSDTPGYLGNLVGENPRLRGRALEILLGGLSSRQPYVQSRTIKQLSELLEDKKVAGKLRPAIAGAYDGMVKPTESQAKAEEAKLVANLAVHDVKYLARLRELYADPVVDVQRSAATRLVGLYPHRPEVVADMRAMVNHPDQWTRVMIVFEMYNLPEFPPEIIGVFREFAQDDSEYVRECVAKLDVNLANGLGSGSERVKTKRVNDGLIDVVVGLAEDPSDKVRGAVADSLRLINKVRSDIVPSTIQKLMQHPGEQTDFDLTSTLDEITGSRQGEMADVLVKLVSSDSLFVANNAAAKIKDGAVAGKKSLREKLPHLRASHDPLIRFWGTLGLAQIGKLGVDEVFDAMEDVLTAPKRTTALDDTHQGAQKRQLVQDIPQFAHLNPTRALELSRIALDDPQMIIRYFGVNSVSDIGSRHGIDVSEDLIRMSGDSDENVRERAMGHLIEHKGDDTTFMTKVLEDPRPKNDVKTLIRTHLSKK
ncbi:MAG: HEAT repeat domain-containing protein [Candidatus Altiarchaeota archaeon]|nr:HEAT repeat domain-containing protein [Candidatus Altiarchaeota archaeon]